MLKKCCTKCNAFHHLRLRNGIFYCTIELPRQNGKRRYYCKSLHTNKYHEAVTMVVQMEQCISKKHIQIKDFLLKAHQYIISGNTDPKIIQILLGLLQKYSSQMSLDEEDIKTIKEIVEKACSLQLDEFRTILETLHKKYNNDDNNPHFTIQYVLDSMLKSSNICDSEKSRKRNAINKMILSVGLNIQSDYMELYNADILQQISNNIQQDTSIKGDTKRKYIRYLTELIKYAHILSPEFYKDNLINVLPKLSKTTKAEKKPHLPYTDEQLKQIFNTENEYFIQHPEDFWSAMIALFTGSRCNASVTLQYGDFIEKDGIKCINFIENHKIKQLKTEASERIVPIPSQLLDLGLWEYVHNKKNKYHLNDNDFIFPKCQTKTGEYNNKFVVRGILKHIEDLGIRTQNGQKYDFHSFRKNASLRLQTANILPAYINDIIGWEGKSTMEQSYSNHTLQEIKQQIDKLQYDCLTDEFSRWKQIMLN